MALLILRGHKVSQQNAVNKVFRELGEATESPTASAYCQARQKLKADLFVQLNQQTVADFYALSEEDRSLVRWHSHRLLGADGTTLNLPDRPALRQQFSVQHNQHGEYVQATAVVLYDLGNDLGLAASLGPVSGEKRPLLDELWAKTQLHDVLVLDRNFADYEIIAHALKNGRNVVIRCPYQFSAVKAFWDSAATDELIDLVAPDSAEIQKFVRRGDLPAAVRVRLLKFTLSTGDIEVLLTTLCEIQHYPHADFNEVYARRWGQETYYDRFKNIFEVERWSGLSVLAIQQDFFGVLFLTSLESVLAQSAQTSLTQRDQLRQPQTPAQVNRAVSYVALLDEVVPLLLDAHLTPTETLARLHYLFQLSPTRRRDDRHYPRPELNYPRRLRYARYRKRLAA